MDKYHFVGTAGRGGWVMPYNQPKTIMASIHRMLVQGAPNTGKTSAFCRTWPRPALIQVAPGEQGFATIPPGEPDLDASIWQETVDGKRASSFEVVQATENLAFEILAKKSIVSYCFDGFHKYYAYILDWMSGGALFKGEPISTDLDPYAAARIYNRTREHARYFVQRVNASPVENVLWTCWDGREADDPAKGFKSQMHVFPGLPGQAAKEFMGEFGLVVHARIDWGKRQVIAPKDTPKGVLPTQIQRFEAKWQLIPEGDVWGASVKAPLQVVERLPTYCEQSYGVLKKILEDAYAQAGIKTSKEGK